MINLVKKKIKNTKKPQNTSYYLHLKKQWTRRHRALEKKLWKNHGKILTNFSLIPKQQILGSIMLASTPFMSIPAHTTVVLAQQQVAVPIHVSPGQLSSQLKTNLPSTVQKLSSQEEQVITKILSRDFHISVTPELSGIRLNRSYGLIGQEQHLRRYPGDTTDQHFDNAEDARLYAEEGTAPGLGAWGYFAQSKEQMTEQDKLRERYYIAVQTFLSPGWNQHIGEYGLFFKYRKMLVVNPDNGRGIIADIADAGPAEWTGKSLGGSPEVMHYLDRRDGAEKGPVLYFFIDDPRDTIPLGPIKL